MAGLEWHCKGPEGGLIMEIVSRCINRKKAFNGRVGSESKNIMTPPHSPLLFFAATLFRPPPNCALKPLCGGSRESQGGSEANLGIFLTWGGGKGGLV